MTKKRIIYNFVIVIIMVSFIVACGTKSSNESDPLSDLPGMWNIAGDFLQSGADNNLFLQINEIEPTSDDENVYLAVGCMQMDTSENWAPLSLQAEFNTETNSYELNILSTILLPEADSAASVIRFVGGAEMYSSGVDDDRANGLSYSALGEVEWTGRHINQQLFVCPQELDEALRFQGEVGNGRDLAYTPPLDTTNFHAETMIVSAQMRVETPDGQVILVSYQTDIFTPYINFIDSFRYHGGLAGTPIISQPYHFTLLNVLGEPILGAVSSDTYIHCDHGAATNIRAEYDQGNFLEISWDAPELIPGRFDPENGHGVYQITLEYHPWQEGGFLYGAEVYLTTHQAPWGAFEPGSAGSPDGNDYGVSLSELENGQFIINVATYDYYEPAEGEVGNDCRVTDSRQGLIITKQDDRITFQPVGAVSGFIYDEDGNPLAEIAVEINGTDTNFHERVCSEENGFYLFTRIPMDTFLLSVGGFGTESCDPNNFASLSLPEITLTADNPIRDNLDFFLTPQE